MSKAWRMGLHFAGLTMFAFAFKRIGAGPVLHDVRTIGGGILIIIGLSLVRLLLQTRSWSAALKQDGIHAGAMELMFLRLASQGIGYVTVLGPAASEPIKIQMLRHYGSGTAATLVDTGLYWLASGLVIVAGCVSPLLLVTNARFLPGAAILGTAVLAALYLIAQPKLLLTPLVPRLRRRCPGWLKKAARVEIAIRQFAAQNPAVIRRMFFLDLACQALLLLEVVVVFWCLNLPSRAEAVLEIETATRGVKIFASWMPARMGADESGAAGAFVLLGLPAASGLAFALARRIRDMLNCLAGLIWLAWRTRSSEEFPGRQQAPSVMLNGELICKP